MFFCGNETVEMGFFLWCCGFQFRFGSIPDGLPVPLCHCVEL